MKNLSTIFLILSYIQSCVEPPPITRMITELEDKNEGFGYNNVRLLRKPASMKSETNDYKVTLFENGKPEEFLFF